MKKYFVLTIKMKNISRIIIVNAFVKEFEFEKKLVIFYNSKRPKDGKKYYVIATVISNENLQFPYIILLKNEGKILSAVIRVS